MGQIDPGSRGWVSPERERPQCVRWLPVFSTWHYFLFGKKIWIIGTPHFVAEPMLLSPHDDLFAWGVTPGGTG